MNRRWNLWSALLTAAVWAATAAVYARMPAVVPIHWDIHGGPNGYAPKSWGVFLSPLFMLVMLGLAWALPRISPRRFEVDTFRSTFALGMFLVIALLAYIHVVVLWAGLNRKVDVGRAIIGGLSVFFAILGNYLGKTRRNFWMGVRTPWTLASDRVWNDTHRLAARLLVGAGILGLIITLSPLPSAIAFVTVIVLILAASLFPVAYSLIRYKQLERRGEL